MDIQPSLPPVLLWRPPHVRMSHGAYEVSYNRLLRLPSVIQNKTINVHQLYKYFWIIPKCMVMYFYYQSFVGNTRLCRRLDRQNGNCLFCFCSPCQPSTEISPDFGRTISQRWSWVITVTGDVYTVPIPYLIAVGTRMAYCTHSHLMLKRQMTMCRAWSKSVTKSDCVTTNPSRSHKLCTPDSPLGWQHGWIMAVVLVRH